jgi:hypothetical protein
VVVYLYDQNDRPVLSQGYRANAILVVGGATQRFPLQPAGPNRLIGTAPVPIPAGAKGAVQIIGPDGRWHDVVPSPGALLVNLGDLTATWTNDRWRSTLHRVLPPARHPSEVRTRRSVAFFHDGNHDALVEVLPTCTSADHPPKYAPIRAGEHLMNKLLGPRTLTVSNAVDTTGGRLAQG